MARVVTILLFPDFQILDATGPIAAFEIASTLVADAYRLDVRAHRAGAVRSSSGVSVVAQPLGRASGIHTLLVAGGDGVAEAVGCARTRAFIRRCAHRAQRVASVCSGTYLLAAEGLLDGKSATTHWCRTSDFALRYPAVNLQPDKIFVRSGKVWTSAGISAGIDLALAMIASDLGERVARAVARQLVVYYRRPGGQTQFSAMLDVPSESRFDALLDYVRRNLAEPLRVDDLAKLAGMSPRNFCRLFTSDLGLTPAKAVERLRVEAARADLDSGSGVAEVALRCGFGDAERMRRAFQRRLGVSPSWVRRAQTPAGVQRR